MGKREKTQVVLSKKVSKTIKKSSPLASLVIRTAAVRSPELGFILACDPKQIALDTDHTIAFRWKAGNFNSGSAKYNAIALSIVEKPEYGVVKISSGGVYSMETVSGIVVSNVFRDATPARSSKRYGDLRTIRTIDQRAYVAGFEGMVYRLDGPKRWIRIDEGLPESFDIEDVAGFNDDELYAVGFRGEAWIRLKQMWEPLNIGVNKVLSTVHCTADGNVFIAGHQGLLVRGRFTKWEVLPQEINEDIWDLAWFNGQLYASTLFGLFRLVNDQLEPVDFGVDKPQTTQRLSIAPGILWSIGSNDLMSFDGQRWTRIV